MTNQYVTKRPDGWAVMGEGNAKATVILERQADAANRARKILENSDGGELVIQGLDRKFRQKDTINRADKFPPKG